MTRALHNEVAVRAGIPLSQYILEANEHYYDRALETPWLFARYVVMFRPNEDVHQPWQLGNERVSLLWAGDQDFHHFYDELFVSGAEAIYVIDEDALRAYARSRDLSEKLLPALSTRTGEWDVANTDEALEQAIREWRFYKKMSLGKDPAAEADEHTTSN